MKEREDIIHAYKSALQQGKKTALATVVHVEGSSYRRPGARMLVTEDGELTGAISGGCLEGDALRKALLCITQQQNKLVTYDSTGEDDSSIGIQLGCNGIVYILFEPVNPAAANNPIALLEAATKDNRHSVIATFFSLHNSAAIQPGTCLLHAGNSFNGDIPFTDKEAVMSDMQMQLQERQSAMKQYTNSNDEPVSCFMELISPAVQLVIAGAGNDAFPLVKMADVLGWHVTVMDGRKTHASQQRFPGVDRILVGKPASLVSQIQLHAYTAFVLMSHNYQYDLAMLRALISNNHVATSYIGVLGPKKKLEKLLDELKDEGIPVTDATRQTVYGPVGIDIGAETAEEIALSIVAEIKAVFAGRHPASLRNKQGAIHEDMITHSQSISSATL